MSIFQNQSANRGMALEVSNCLNQRVDLRGEFSASDHSLKKKHSNMPSRHCDHYVLYWKVRLTLHLNTFFKKKKPFSGWLVSQHALSSQRSAVCLYRCRVYARILPSTSKGTRPSLEHACPEASYFCLLTKSKTRLMNHVVPSYF